MPFVIVNRERFALPIGETRVGGTGDDVLPFPELTRADTVAILSVLPDGTATVRRVNGAPVSLNGQPLGPDATPLIHGARIDAAGLHLVFGDLRDAGTTAHVHGVTEDDRALFAAIASVEPTADSGGRLTAMATGTVYPIPDAGLVIGRDPDCDVIIAAKKVSRRHATIRPSIQGYVLTDISTTGTFVNSRRIDGSQVLGMGDVIRIGDEDLRFEADAAIYEPAAELRVGKTAVMPRPAPTFLATLEITSDGAQKGTQFHVERPVVHIGRHPANDIHLGDDTVSGLHATLARRGSTWVLLDRNSTNGTYVDGERVEGERALSGEAELRFGGVEMIFRPS
ncbi:MAG: FHA domain-containing protein [Gemmatimonadaceae bacterium]